MEGAPRGCVDRSQQRISFAQNGEDVRLWRAFDSIEIGFYVEVGGWKPEDDSVSRSFYNRGWSGIVLEPVPELASEYARERPRDRVLPVLAGGSAGTLEFYMFPETGLSTMVQDHARRHIAEGFECITAQLPVTTLNSVLGEAGVRDIHFMLIDAEGAEEDVLKGLDLSTYRPWVLVVESTLPNQTLESHGSWEHLILGHDYLLVGFDGLNRYYVAMEHSNLASALAPPPNVHDDFVTLAHHRERLDNKAVREQLEVALAQLEVAQLRGQLLNAQLQNARFRSSQAVLEVQRANEATTRQWEQNEALAHELREVARARDLFARERDARTAEVQALCQSLSWRITKPLRRVRQVGGR